MSEYWVSQGRKMCTYCKCWTADNKASINFHEQGKKHKENVKLKLDELKKKGIADQKKRDEESNSLAAIEEAALSALKKDLTADPNVASSYGIKDSKVDDVKTKLDLLEKKRKQVETEKLKAESSKSAEDTKNTEPQYLHGDWYSCITEDGHTYYWNEKNNETTWNYPPKEFKPHGQKSSQASYGGWETIKEPDPEPTVDLQLPTDSSNFQFEADVIPMPTAAGEISEEPASKKFREKTVTLTQNNSEQTITFKKRKIANRGRRKQTDDS